MRKSKDELMGIRISSEMREKIRKIAHNEDTSESAIIRRILKKNLPAELTKVNH